MIALPSVADVVILPKVAHMGLFTARDKTAKAVKSFAELCNTLEN
jgi:hypothetical protein